MHDFSGKVQKFSGEVQNDLRGGAHLLTPPLKIRPWERQLSSYLILNNLMFPMLFCSDLAKSVPLEVDPYTYDSPHTKTFLLFQAHFSMLTLPCSDYHTDTKSVLDQAIRILQVINFRCFVNIKGIRQYIFLLFHFKELLKLYVNLFFRFCVTFIISWNILT